MTKSESSANQNTLDNPAMNSGLQNDILHKKSMPVFSDEAQLVSGIKAPVGLPEHEVKENVIGQKDGISYFNDPPKLAGYVEQAKVETYISTHQEMRPAEIKLNEKPNLTEVQKQHNVQILVQQQQQVDNTVSPHSDGLNLLPQQVMSKQDVLNLLAAQNKPNLAGKFAAMSAHVESSAMSDENKNNVQQKLNQATLAYAERVDDRTIAAVNIEVPHQAWQKNLEP